MTLPLETLREPEVQTVEVDGVPMSARVLAVPDPKAVLVCFSGGAASTKYWDCPGHPQLSLLRTGAALGYSVVALDRPGYGASRRLAVDLAPADRRVELTFGAIEALNPSGAEVLVVGHSLGCELGIRLAADPRGAVLLGLAISGTGTTYHPRSMALMTGVRTGRREGAARTVDVAELVWGRKELYPDGMAGGLAIVTPSPAYEGPVVATWLEDLPPLAAAVRVPVHYTLAEHETVWAPNASALAGMASLFTSSPRVVTHEQRGAGHNISVGLTATAYHLNVLAFAEESLAARRREQI